MVAESGTQPYQYRLQNPALGVRFDVWANGSMEVTRAMQGETVVQYRFDRPQKARSVTSRGAIERYLSLGEYRVTDRTTRNGTTLVTLRADEFAVEETDGLFVKGSENVSNYSSTVVVDGEGRVRHLTATADYTIDGEDATLDMEYRLLRLGGVSVERPGWVATALERRGGGSGGNRSG